mgnify:CR=1 FL=1
MTIQEAWEASPTRTVTARIARERGVESYAVGGAVRDVLLGREPHDWDVASRDALRLARAVARELHAAFVWLHDMPATARVVIRGDQDGQTREELDYSDFRGDTIVEDLLARDFTVNSMAWRMGPSSISAQASVESPASASSTLMPATEMANRCRCERSRHDSLVSV